MSKDLVDWLPKLKFDMAPWMIVGSRPAQKGDEDDNSSRDNSNRYKGRTHQSHTYDNNN